MPQPRRLRHAVEAALIRGLFILFHRLGVERASALGGWIARTLGPWLPIHRAAAKRLRRALPDLDAAAAEAVLSRMWDNLGRVVAEYPHLGAFRVATPDHPDGRIEVAGREHVQRIVDAGRQAVFFSAHYGNWELPVLTAGQLGLPLVLIYREANNPAVEAVIQRARSAAVGAGRLLPKGAAGGRAALAAMAAGQSLGLLVDQKMNDGIPVPFFGRDAMTAPALARLALRFRCAVIPVRVERLPNVRFRVVVGPPLDLPESGDQTADLLAIMTAVNRQLEEWIRARPDHWFWLHRRWPD